MFRAYCEDCSDDAPIGPATDTAEVMVEIAAATAAAERAPELVLGMADVECTFDLPVEKCETCQAQQLAACILNHDAEQAETGGEG